MTSPEMKDREGVRLNNVDWDILSVMADGKRYTPAYLYNDVEALDEYGDDWIRQRIKHLRDNGLIENVGTSSMYTITRMGEAAIKIQGEHDDLSPREFTERVMELVDE